MLLDTFALSLKGCSGRLFSFHAERMKFVLWYLFSVTREVKYNQINRIPKRCILNKPWF